MGHRPVPGVALGGVLAPAQVVEGGGVGVDVADAGAALDRHVAHRHAPLHGQPLDGGPGVLVGVADTALDTELPNDVQGHVLGADPRAQAAVDFDAAYLERIHAQALGGEHVAHLGGADAEGERAEGAVGRGVRVPAGHGHARVHHAELRSDDVDDALAAGIVVEEGDTELGGVALQGRHHLLGLGVGVGPHASVGRDDVIHGGHGALGVEQAQPALAQHVARLRRRHLVHEVQTDEQLVLSGGQPGDDVRVPYLVVERVFCHDNSCEASPGPPCRGDPRARRARRGERASGGVARRAGERCVRGRRPAQGDRAPAAVDSVTGAW